jgi:hypothetical protein
MMTNFDETADPLPLGRRLTDSGPISRSKDPLIIWIAYAFVMFCVLSIVLSKTLFNGLTAYSSYFSMIIATTFIGAFFYSFIEARRLHNEWMGINRLQNTLENAKASQL